MGYASVFSLKAELNTSTQSGVHNGVNLWKQAVIQRAVGTFPALTLCRVLWPQQGLGKGPGYQVQD